MIFKYQYQSLFICIDSKVIVLSMVKTQGRLLADNTGQLLAAIITSLQLVAINPKAYASRMSKKPKQSGRIREGQMKLIALLLYIAEKKQKSLDTVGQLLRFDAAKQGLIKHTVRSAALE
jgi:hypothetical protein